ncbi:RNA-binding protein [Zobellella taiwanensis]|uniref:RNA-binding protein n=1 Tax=Zobellella taiwanensis TaxID=347535 RepID=A0A2P7QXZ6_9GAMM|nr:RNA-binding protein [Zobellella taiwanensis]PSJ42840.1 RNA-binding protein [Zobellella taiwanensis]
MKTSRSPFRLPYPAFALLLAVAGYIAVALSGLQLSPALMFAAGLLLGGVITTLVTKAAPAPPAELPTTTLYVGNLPYRANEASVRELFEPFGQVVSVRLMKDKNTGKRRGFGFVEMPSDAATAAQQALNDTEFQQRTLKVREANERKEEDADQE